MPVTAEVSPFRWPQTDAGPRRFGALARFVRGQTRCQHPSFAVEMDVVREKREDIPFGYGQDTWRHGRGPSAITVTHRTECVEMGPVTGSADVATVTAEGLQDGNSLALKLVRAARDPAYNATLTL